MSEWIVDTTRYERDYGITDHTQALMALSVDLTTLLGCEPVGELVRCGECRWLRPIGGDRLGESFYCGRDWFLPTLRKVDADGMVVEHHPQVDLGDYCSKGERRDQTP